MFCFPLKNFQNEVIGVVQLINCRPRKRSGPVPFDPDVETLVAPIARVVGHSIERAEMLDEIKGKNKTLHTRNRQLADQRQRIAALQEETEEAFQVSVTLLARAAEIHDEETGNHILRVNEYSYYIAQLLQMPPAWCDEIRYSAQLHDVGKMSVDAAVLKKKGGLNDSERDEMNRHTLYGYQILTASPRLSLGAEIALGASREMGRYRLSQRHQRRSDPDVSSHRAGRRHLRRLTLRASLQTLVQSQQIVQDNH